MRTFMTLFIAASVGLTAQAQPSANKPLHKKNTNTGVSIFTVDAAASTINWTGKKVKGQHTGTVNFKEGSFEVNNKGIVGGTLVIDMATIKCSDLTDAEYNKKLVDHLISEDFFDVAKNPTATYKIKSFSELHTFAPGAPNAIVKGDLTIRGVTKPQQFTVFYYPKDGGFEVKGKALVDRTQYGVKYNSKKFFSLAKLGDKMIDDKFELDLNIVVKKQ